MYVTEGMKTGEKFVIGVNSYGTRVEREGQDMDDRREEFHKVVKWFQAYESNDDHVTYVPETADNWPQIQFLLGGRGDPMLAWVTNNRLHMAFHSPDVTELEVNFSLDDVGRGLLALMSVIRFADRMKYMILYDNYQEYRRAELRASGI